VDVVLISGGRSGGQHWLKWLLMLIIKVVVDRCRTEGQSGDRPP